MMWQAGAPVPYPVQLDGTEILLEFIGDPDGTAAPRLTQFRGTGDELHDLWDQCVDVICLLAAAGLAHGDLSAYNLLVHNGRLVVIDVPQAIDVVANPRGHEFLRRDAENVCRLSAARGCRGRRRPERAIARRGQDAATRWRCRDGSLALAADRLHGRRAAQASVREPAEEQTDCDPQHHLVAQGSDPEVIEHGAREVGGRLIRRWHDH